MSNRIDLDAFVQTGSHPDKIGALIPMLKCSPIYRKAILNADRGYECYNIFAHAQENGWNYLIRMKDFGSRGTITNLSLSSLEEFDCPVLLILTKKQTEKVNPIRTHPIT